MFKINVDHTYTSNYISDDTQGDAVFWYNLHGNGSVDTRMLHAGCPVILGNKWSKS